MVQGSENFAFLLETGDNNSGRRGWQHKLDGDVAVKGIVRSLGQIDDASSASPDFTSQGVTAKASAFHPGQLRIAQRLSRAERKNRRAIP